MINDFQCGSIAQRIINGTDKLPMPDRKRYVYLVYVVCDDYNELLAVYEHEAVAIGHMWDIARECGYDTHRPYDWDTNDCRGWQDIAFYETREVQEVRKR